MPNRAGPCVSSSIAARKPPWTVPPGLRKRSSAVKPISIVPAAGSIARSVQPSSLADGGASKRSKTEGVRAATSITFPPLAPPASGRGTGLQGPLAFFDLEGFEEVARLQVGEVLGERHAALKPGADLRHVVLEAAQRGDFAGVGDDVVAGDAGLQCLADDALGDEQAGG